MPDPPTSPPADSTQTVQRDIDHVLISSEKIAERIGELGAEIARDLDKLDDESEILLLPILTGAIVFLADLIRQLPQKVKIDVVTVSSYPGTSTTSKGAAIIGALPADVEGRHVLIVDDILDSGETIQLIRTELAKRNPASVRACVLLRKRIASAMETPCEYVGFDIPDEFVVGYGLDYDHYYRNLPYVGTLKGDAL